MMVASSGQQQTMLFSQLSVQRACPMPGISSTWFLCWSRLLESHILGDRMIASGVDGISQGNYDVGISLGFDVCQFMWLNLSAWDVAGKVLADWCKSWIEKDYAPPLLPVGWLEEGHRPGFHVWTPPLAVALISLKELSRSCHKHPSEVTHVVMILGPGAVMGNHDLRRKWISGLFCIMVHYCLTLHLNLYWSLFFVQIILLLAPWFPGRSNKYRQEWWTWDVSCKKCQSHVTYKLGIICANFGLRQGHFQACSAAWCAPCFSPHPLDWFEVKMPWDYIGASLAEVEVELRFKQAQPGDHLCIPFQCPNCQNQNIWGKAIHPYLIDDLLDKCMVVQATLDAFWSRASKTVVNHVQEVRNMAQYGQLFGYPPMLVLGPCSLYNHLRMDAAIMVLMRLMEKGKAAGATAKYRMARKAWATLTVLWKSSPLSGDDLTLSAGLVRVYLVAPFCPSEGWWYQHFETGICAQWYTIEVLLALVEMYKQEWQTYYLGIFPVEWRWFNVVCWIGKGLFCCHFLPIWGAVVSALWDWNMCTNGRHSHSGSSIYNWSLARTGRNVQTRVANLLSTKVTPCLHVTLGVFHWRYP